MADGWGGLVRNRAFSGELALLAAAEFFCAFMAIPLGGIGAAWWVLAAGAVACALFAVFSVRRYREIARLAAEVDEVLHVGRRINFTDCREGDLAILKNELSKMVATLRDTTERLEHEKTALADALADVSHQIRTPLTAMGLMVPLIERSADDSERTRTLHELDRLIDRVGWLVSSLLKIAKVDAGAIRVRAERVDAAGVAREAVVPLAVALDVRGVECTIDAEDGAAFTGDAAWSAEALENIVKNCMEHTPPGGSIRIAISEDALACRIRVTDTGPGIAPEDLPHLFERFYRGSSSEASEVERRADAAHAEGETSGPDAATAKETASEAGATSGVGATAAASRANNAAPASDEEVRQPPGFGIGLALAQALIAAQGGTLRAGNAPEGGARFDLAFPKITV